MSREYEPWVLFCLFQTLIRFFSLPMFFSVKKVGDSFPRWNGRQADEASLLRRPASPLTECLVRVLRYPSAPFPPIHRNSVSFVAVPNRTIFVGPSRFAILDSLF